MSGPADTVRGVDSAARAASLQSITAALGRALTVEDVAQIVIELGLPGVGARAGAVGLLSDDGTAVELVRAVGYPTTMVVGLRRMALHTTTPITEAVRTAAPAWRDSVQAEGRFDDFVRQNRGFQAGAGLPLMIDGQAIGAIGLSFDDARVFSQAEREFMLAMAAQCAQAVERVRLYQAERAARAAAEHAAARTARLQSLTAELSDVQSTAHWARVALEQTSIAVGADRGLIYLVQEAADGRQSLEAIHTLNYPSTVLARWRTLPLVAGWPVTDAVLAGEPICVASAAELLARYPAIADIPRSDRSSAWACVPLLAGRQVLGAIALTFNQTLSVGDEDLRFMQTLAGQCAQALERARLLERERAGHEEAALLQAVASSAAGQRDLQGILQASLERLRTLIPFSGGSMALVEGERLVVRAAEGAFAEQLLDGPTPPGGELARQVVDSGQPWLSDDLQTDSDVAPTPVRAYLGVPLAWEDRRFGLLEVHASQPGVFSPQHLELLRKVAVTVSRSVELARLYAIERAGREQLDAILSGVADGVVVQGADRRFIYANEPAARLAGFASAEDYLGARQQDISARLTVVDEQGQPFPYENLPAQRALRGEPTAEMVVQFRRHDTGEVHWSLTRSRAIRGPNGEMLAISIFHDITERIRSEERLRFLAEAGAYLADSLDVNDTLAAISHLATQTLADWAVVYLVQGEEVQQAGASHRDPACAMLVEELRQRYSARPIQTAAFWRAIQSGRTVAVPEISAAQLADVSDDDYMNLVRDIGLTSALYTPLVARGRTLGAIGLFTGGSGRRLGDHDRAIAEEIARRAALALDNARLYGEAQAAIRARDEFLSIASHELRTPVTAISGVAQLLQRTRQRGALDEQRLERGLNQIRQGSARLVALTEDLLDVSRLQTGHFDLRPVQIDVAAFLTDLVERTNTQPGVADSRTIVLHTAASDVFLAADPARLEQVVANLLSNAAKYSPEGGNIEVELQASADGVVITVADQGIGLPPGSEETIFQPFGRGPNAAARQIQGLGLGLYICRQIVERHGGRIWADSRGEGLGTTFWVWLPRGGSDALAQPVSD